MPGAAARVLGRARRHSGAAWCCRQVVAHAQQRAGQGAAARPQVGGSRVEVLLLHDDLGAAGARLRGVHHRSAHELAQVGGRDAVRGGHCSGEVEGVEPGVRAVQPQQPLPAGGVGYPDLHCLVDPARPFRQRAFQHLDPVRRQHEHDVDVVAEPVELVQDLEEQRVGAGRHEVAVGRDEVDVLQDHDRGLMKPASVQAAATRPNVLPDRTTAVVPSSRPSR